MEASTLYNIETVVCPGVDELFARALEFMWGGIQPPFQR